MKDSIVREKFQVSYDSPTHLTRPNVSITTPPVPKKEAMEFVSAIGIGRVTQILENGVALNPEQTFKFLRAALPPAHLRERPTL